MQDTENDLKSAFAEALEDSDRTDNTGQTQKAGIASIEFTKWAAIICLIGATLPFMTAYRLFGISAAVFLALFIIIAIIYRKNIPKQKITRACTVIGTTMLLTGCSGFSALLASDPVPLVVAQNPDKEYKMGVTEELGLFGFGLDDAREETAMQHGNIKKAYATQTTRSFGWISVARVRVYGE